MKVLFIDVDGTIINSYSGIKNSLFHALEEHNWPLLSEEEAHRIPGPPMEVTLRGLGMDENTVAKVFATYRTTYDTEGWKDSSLYPGWPEQLQKWRDEGYILCTATSKNDVIATTMLKHLGIADYFHFIGGSDLGGSRRDKASVIKWVLDSMDLGDHTDRILMIGDREHDRLGADQFGIPTALVAWGHGNQEEFDAADYHAPDMEALAAIVDGHFAGDSVD